MPTGIGDALRGAREDQGRTLEEAARATRVRVDFLEALEAERFEAIGGDVYAKGFLRTYARWLNLDPEPLLETYRRRVQRPEPSAHALVEYPVARQPRAGPPTWATWAIVSAVVLIVVFALVGLLGRRAPEPAAEPDLPTTASPTPGGTPDASGPSPSPSPSPSPEPTAVELVVLVEDDSWMRVRVRGETVFQETVPAGGSREFQAADQLEIRFGNGGGVRLVLNGRDLGSPAGRGEPITLLCTPAACEAA